MVVEYIRYRIDADRSDVFVKAYEDAQTSLQQSPQCLGHYAPTPLRWSR